MPDRLRALGRLCRPTSRTGSGTLQRSACGTQSPASASSSKQRRSTRSGPAPTASATCFAGSPTWPITADRSSRSASVRAGRGRYNATMAEFDRYNDGSNEPPKLRIQHSLWSLIGLPMNAATEWSLDEKFERVKGAGFEGVECWLDDSTEAEHKRALDRHQLRLTLGHHPHTLEDVKATVARAR